MLAIVGTVPELDFPVLCGEVSRKGDALLIQGREVPVHRGTPALIAAAAGVLEMLGQENPLAFLVGDIGLGHGSRRLYDYVIHRLPEIPLDVLAFHYLQPDVDWHNRVLFAVEDIPRRPILVADAGFMYAAKMSGQASAYDLFTPDLGELAFLADEEAPHPFYTRGFILHDEKRVPELIARAYKHDNAARLLLVKGATDYVAGEKGILATIESPSEEALEAIGGTGDTLTGIVSALIQAGYAAEVAAVMGARVNRLAGSYARPTPASQVMDLVVQIPKALEDILALRSSQGLLHPGTPS
jgi:hypothetical protein